MDIYNLDTTVNLKLYTTGFIVVYENTETHELFPLNAEILLRSTDMDFLLPVDKEKREEILDKISSNMQEALNSLYEGEKVKDEHTFYKKTVGEFSVDIKTEKFETDQNNDAMVSVTNGSEDHESILYTVQLKNLLAILGIGGVKHGA